MMPQKRFTRFTRFIDKAQVVKCSSWPVAWLRRRVLRSALDNLDDETLLDNLDDETQ